MFFIGIDVGTTVIKSVLFDDAGREVKVAQATVPIKTSRPGFQEQDMDEVWRAVLETLRELCQGTRIWASAIRAIGVTGQGAGCWLIDREGRPVREAILWSDSRAAGIIEDWQREGVLEQVYKICGSIQYSGCQSAIIKWLAENEPDSLKAAKYTLWAKDWIKYKLSGVVGTDPSDSSVSFLDIVQGEYSSKILELLGIADYAYLLPPVYPCYKVTGPLLPDVASELGLSREVLVVGAPFDMIATTLGVGAVGNGDACSILGTAQISQVTLDNLAIEPLNVGFTICHGVPGRWVRAMAAMLGTPNLDWFLNTFCYEDRVAAESLKKSIFEYAEETISKLPIGSGGVIYHPYLSPAGERSPFVNENAKAHFIGLSQEHSRHHLLRAVYEGVALAIKHCYESIPGTVQKVSLSGGGAKSPLWCQMIADALNAVVRVPSGTEFGAKGAAINAMVALGLFDSYEAAVAHCVSFEREYHPHPNNHKQYQKLYQIYLKVINAMLEPWEMLAPLRKAL